MALKKLVDLWDEKVDGKIKATLASLGSVDSPLMGLLPYEDAIKVFKPKVGETFFCTVPVGMIHTDTTYNRGDNIHYKNIFENLKEMRGFCHKASGAISLFVRPGNKLVTTKGNHRVSMRYGSCLDPDALISAEVTMHDVNCDYSEIIKIEASDHDVDCNFRTPQKTDDKFKASYYAGRVDSINIYRYLDKFGIGIAGTNATAKYQATSYRKIEESRKLDEHSCTRYLKAFTDVVSEKEVMGNATLAASWFLYHFREPIKYIDENNNIDSVTEFVNYIYNDRHNKSHGYLNTVDQYKMSDPKIKTYEIGVARLISLYNEFCNKSIQAIIPKSNKHAIGYSSKEYQSFIQTANPNLRLRAEEVAQSTV